MNAIDASGKMKRKKKKKKKKAGIALSYKAIEKKDKVGLIVFGKDVRSKVRPTDNFERILTEIAKVSAAQETDIVKTINKAIEMFPKDKATKHLLLLTDALPTIGKRPERETLKEVSKATSAGITISVVGINLDEKGKNLAEQITTVGNGRLYKCKNLQKLDKIILQDYYSVL